MAAVQFGIGHFVIFMLRNGRVARALCLLSMEQRFSSVGCLSAKCLVWFWPEIWAWEVENLSTTGWKVALQSKGMANVAAGESRRLRSLQFQRGKDLAAGMACGKK